MNRLPITQKIIDAPYATQYFNRRVFRSVQQTDTECAFVGLFHRTFSFNLFIRRHKKSPKFDSVWEAKLLPHDTD